MERSRVEQGENRAVFLDRDGTIVEDVGYLTSPDEMRLLPGAAAALKRLKSAGFLLLVVTNQSAIARGWLKEEQLEQIHRHLQQLLRREGVEIDDFFYCPHLPEGRVARYAKVCSCRKPQPGMLLRGAAKWNVNLARSFAVGDSERDAQAGRRAGCYSILISPDSTSDTCANAVVASLAEAADVIIGSLPATARQGSEPQ